MCNKTLLFEILMAILCITDKILATMHCDLATITNYVVAKMTAMAKSLRETLEWAIKKKSL